mmetsp:Transcript_39362/g.94623  ORF Transcript_39362/g.94623 Transcript_39362/m.94623 type:complete len:203 (+) Transcript_39362:96-704(+)
MVVPLVPMVAAPPTDTALKLKPWLATVVIAQFIVALLRFVIGDIWGGLSDMIVCLFGYYAVEDLTMLHTLWYSVMCGFNCMFDLLYLAIRVAELRRHYFHKDMPVMYNLASAVLIAAPVIAAVGCILSYRMYAEARDNLLGEGEAMIGRDQPSGLGGRHQNSAGYPAATYGGTQTAVLQEEQQAQNRFVPFSGNAHRMDTPR